MLKKVNKKNHIELLAPAGSFQKMSYAFHYGADAVYAGIPEVSMRSRINAFSEKSLAEGAEFAHSRGKKLYVTLNIYAHNYHLPQIEKHLKFLRNIAVDAVIVSDPGIIMLIKKYLPKTEIHLSTQANTTNWMAAKFWFDLGVKRIVLAREVTLEDIREIKKHVPKLEIEYFVHGAMCMSYSGRCMLSKWMSGKSANLGDCTQPCRWAYDQRKSQISNSKFQINSKDQVSNFKTMELAEKQKGIEVDLEEDFHGTYFFNSKDLNLIGHLNDLIEAGVTSLKIEGRNKSVFYVSNVVRSYRAVLDAIAAGKNASQIQSIEKKSAQELDKLANRGYTKGFLLGWEPEHNFYNSGSDNSFQFVGEVMEAEKNILKTKVHNAIAKGSKLEVVTPEKIFSVDVLGIRTHDGMDVESAHGGHGNAYEIAVNKKGIQPMSLLRKIVM